MRGRNSLPATRNCAGVLPASEARMKFYRQMLLMGLTILSIGICRADTAVKEYPVDPYVDPTQLNLPWGAIDFYKQPWRAYMQTKSGYDFLQGIGINYNLPGNDDVA